MICKECGEKHCEFIGVTSTLMYFSAFQDAEEHWHHHDENRSWGEWVCKNGHKFYGIYPNRCWCGWSAQYPDKAFHEDKPVDPNAPLPVYEFVYQPSQILNEKWIAKLRKSQEKTE